MPMNDDRMKLPINANPVDVHDPLRFNQGGQADPYSFARDTMQNEAAEAAVYNTKVVNIMQEVCTSCIISSCWKFKSTSCILQKLEDAVHEMGLQLKHHEENIIFLKAHKNRLDNSILDMQVALGKYQTASESGSENEELSHVQSEEETLGNIFLHEKSAAGIWYELKCHHGTQASHLPLMKDVVGIVAMLGSVDDDNLSRLLSDYLGLETMLAIVCKTFDGMKALETYDEKGHINKSLGLHGLGASIGKPLDGRFLVICLEKLRPYAEDFIADDPQRRLDILKPRLPNGDSPPGFLGFAVNMVNIDSVDLYCATSTGYGLRETLFYNLFSRLHVYKTREDMLQSLPCIRHGAISLDGGMIKHSGVFSLGKREINVKFPKSSRGSNLPQNYFEIGREIKEMKWKKERTVEDMQREQVLLERARFNFDLKKQGYMMFLAQSSTYATQLRILHGDNMRVVCLPGNYAVVPSML
ncbi:protein DEFECTIVE IN MERISTEM SILENCING 3 isoform X2 [Solanum lycopersicum]|nr:protein DEFECTIVE IN MERISTEM SILENCING 3 isoform X2 [Solanum lycopersicum]